MKGVGKTHVDTVGADPDLQDSSQKAKRVRKTLVQED